MPIHYALATTDVKLYGRVGDSMAPKPNPHHPSAT